ncbi:hypothetical protein QT971_05355 [Microcoleus sp. herbarium19]|uniref:hypothetical protein n=1 Tax=unclassified Microcoleus TaxID=2642155 RepID=UPI002FD6678C
MIKVRWLALAIAISLLLDACNIPKKDFTCDDLPTSANSQVSQSDTINLAIHVDGSGSMLGYVANDTSRYVQTLELLDRTIALGGSSSKSTIEYYRTGKGSKKITRSDFRKAQKPEFYDGSNPQFPDVASGLATAITPSQKGEQLFVMVSDLDQDGGDVTNLNQKIKETYLNQQKKGYAVGIVAIRSEFQGKVYIADKTRQDFSYDTEGKKNENLRPFYVMFLGPYQDIANYFEKLKREGGQVLDGSQFMILSPNNIVSEISYLSSPEQPLPQDLKQPSSLNDGQVAIEVNDDKKNQLLEIEKDSSQELPINYKVAFTSLSHTLPIDASSIESTFKIKVFDRFNKQFEEKSNDQSLKSFLKFSDWQIDNNNKTLSFVTKISPSQVSQPGVYLFTVDVTAKNLQDPAWWKEWDFDPKRDKTDDGSKTNNLVNFLRGLKTITTELMQDDPPMIGHFCYAIQKN